MRTDSLVQYSTMIHTVLLAHAMIVSLEGCHPSSHRKL